MIRAKFKIKISVYYVTNVFRVIFIIISTNLAHENKIKHMDTDEFDLQEIIRVGHSVLCFFILILVIIIAADIVVYSSFVIINVNVLK